MSRLRTQTMVLLSAVWIDPARGRPLLLGFERGRTLLPHIEYAHKGLLDAQSDGGTVGALDAEIAELQVASQSSNATFVGLTQAIYHGLTSVAALVSTPALAAQYESARDRLFPHGVAVVKWKYTDKAGEVEMASARRTPELDGLLARVALPDGTTLLTHADAWVAAGRALGESERRKHEIEHKRDAASGASVTGREVLQARQRWMRVARMLMEDVALAELPADVAESLVGELQRAIERVSAASSDEAQEASEEPTEEDATKEEAPKATPVVVVPPAAPANDAAPARKVG